MQCSLHDSAFKLPYTYTISIKKLDRTGFLSDLAESESLNSSFNVQGEHALLDTTKKTDILKNDQKRGLNNNAIHEERIDEWDVIKPHQQHRVQALGQGGSSADTSAPSGTFL